MDSNSGVDLSSLNESILSVASSIRPREENLFPEEQLLQDKQLLLERAILETTEENIAYAKEISALLSDLELDYQSLPSDIKDGLDKVALIMREEKIPDFDDNMLVIAREQKKVEEKKRQREEKRLALLHDDLMRKYTRFLRKLEQLQDAVGALEDMVETAKQEREESYSNHVLLSMKLKEYQQTVEKLENDLADTEVEGIYPYEILNKYQKYLELSGELVELNQYLSQFSDLPPNLLQAKAMLEAKQKEYEKVEKEFLEKTQGC